VADEVVESQEAIEIEQPKTGRRGLFRMVQAVAFVSVIVVVEIVVGSMLTPSVEETTRLAQEVTAAAAGKTGQEDDPHAAEDSHASSAADHGLHEVELGIYNVTRFNPATNTTLAIDFELYGTVLAEDLGQFQHAFEQSTARIREQVVMTLHAAESADLTDAGLGLIKRQILEKTNRALGEPLLKEVLFSKFNFVER
jgi:flagellar FliL protein